MLTETDIDRQMPSFMQIFMRDRVGMAQAELQKTYQRLGMDEAAVQSLTKAYEDHVLPEGLTFGEQIQILSENLGGEKPAALQFWLLHAIHFSVKTIVMQKAAVDDNRESPEGPPLSPERRAELMQHSDDLEEGLLGLLVDTVKIGPVLARTMLQDFDRAADAFVGRSPG